MEAGGDLAGAEVVPKMEIVTPPAKGKTYGVSYGWEDESKAIVEKLCADAERRGVKILRDTNGVKIGESLSIFMEELTSGDRRLFVILSRKYLESPYCMFELMEVWRLCQQKPALFRDRIRVYCMKDAAIWTIRDRLKCAIFWDSQFNELKPLVKEHGIDLLGEADIKRYKLMQDFAHRVGDILGVIVDTLQPKDFEQLVATGFVD